MVVTALHAKSPTRINPSVNTAQGEERRCQKLLSRLLEERSRKSVSLERAKSLTASFKTTEGLPTPLRRAKAFENVLLNIPIRIDEDQLLVGDFAASPTSAEWYPECSIQWVIDELSSGQVSADTLSLFGGDLSQMKEVCDYWKGRTTEDLFNVSISQADAEWLRRPGIAEAHFFHVLCENPGGYQALAYDRLVSKGANGLLAEVEQELAATPIISEGSFAKRTFLEAMAIVLKAIRQYGARYAALAAERAAAATGKRKTELQRIAEICAQVPANPARNFHEAVQSMWFAHVLAILETSARGLSPGRLDQYLYPYYRQSIDEGQIDREEVIELLECLRIKMSSLRDFKKGAFMSLASGEAHFHNVTIGGQTAEGKDATNELSFLILEAALRTKTPHHTISIRWHPDLSPELLQKGLELSVTGGGLPAFFNDEKCVPYLMRSTGVSLEEARDYAIGGCVIPTLPGKTGHIHAPVFNMAKLLELALNRGKDFREVLDEHIPICARLANTVALVKARELASLFTSVLTDDCIKRGKSDLGEGAVFKMAYFLPAGMIDVADSLAAMKKCVDQDGSMTTGELLDALQANFKDKDKVRFLLKSAPKYGNDEDLPDDIAADLYRWFGERLSQEDALGGRKYEPAAYSVTLHGPFGAVTGALPNGRPAGMYLSDGSTSPCQGSDTRGPTAVINSAIKVERYPYLSHLLNLKFHPSAVKTKEDLAKVAALIATFFQNHGHHLQFNVISRDDLLEAQMHPERHRGLIVRVAGYSAYFTELSPAIQNEIIDRTEWAI